MSAQPNVIPLPQLETPIDRMGVELLKALVDEVRLAPAQWSKLTEAQQDMLIGRLRSTVRLETEKAVQLIAKGDHEIAHVKIESLTVKDGAKCVLQIGGDAAHDVLDYVGQAAVLVMCDPKQFLGEMDEVKADKQQPELPLGTAPQDPAIARVFIAWDVQVGDDVRFLSASPDGLVRKVRAVDRFDADRTLIQVTGMADEFELSLFERVSESDPIAEVEAEDAAQAAAEEDRMAIDVDDAGADDEIADEIADDEAAALAADAAEDESRRASGGKKRRRRA